MQRALAVAVALAALGGFAVPGGDANQVFATLGYDGIDDIVVTGQGWLAIILFAVGTGMLAWASATAWRQTGGY